MYYLVLLLILESVERYYHFYINIALNISAFIVIKVLQVNKTRQKIFKMCA